MNRISQNTQMNANEYFASTMLENDQKYLVEISPIKFCSEEVFILTSENVMQ